MDIIRIICKLHYEFKQQGYQYTSGSVVIVHKWGADTISDEIK
jgi:hypothetical protein